MLWPNIKIFAGLIKIFPLSTKLLIFILVDSELYISRSIAGQSNKYLNIMKNIELASIDQIDLIMKIIKACTRHMIDNGIFQWNDKYPTKQSFIDDINNNDLFVLKLENKIIGCVCASFDMDEFYKQIVWETSSKKNIYLHRLAIHPDYQGQGFAKYVMDYIENYAKENGCLSVRLDTFSLNKKNNYLYSKLGYKKLGKIYFRDQSDMPFNCYEKLL